MSAVNKTSHLSMGRVALVVNDLDGLRRYYETAVGLHTLSQDGEVVRMGVGREVLLELRRDKSARRRNPREAGLFHTAFLLPDRADLGAWVRNAIDKRIGVDGVSDHLVSEAIYLTDPEGNGIEIYTDRPRDQWQWSGGKVAMSTDPLDVQSLIDVAKTPWKGVTEGTVVGHVHLQVGTIPEAEAFYSGVMGLDITAHYPGGSFYAADGYHHHIATNIWNSRGAGKRSFPSTGLAEVEVRLDATRAAEIRARAGGQIALVDPWGTPISLITTEA